MMNSIVQDTLDTLLDRQKQAWLDGHRPSVKDLLKDSALPADADTLLDLIYNEIVVREEMGETPSVDEYVEHYPHLRNDLKLHLEVHRAIQENLLEYTLRTPMSGSQPEAETTETTGPSLNDYELLGELGRGGMGVVYKARQRRLKRLVALKMFQPGRNPTVRELARFRAEAEAIARLQHPNIVQIFEVGEENQKPFLALELAEGGTLAAKLQEMPLEPRAAAELIETLARAIQHAHEQQIVHRDLKPANVLFAKDGTPKITDFGLAKLLEEDLQHDATRSGEPIGTPRYMSPEQAAGRPEQIGPATDVYALGTLLYECVTGQAPFVSASVVETIDKIRNEDPVPLRRLQRSVPRNLETICMRCLHKEPARRYGSAQQLADDLCRFLHGEPIHARRTSVLERGWMWGRRRPALSTLIAIGFAFVLAAPIFLVVHHIREQRRLDEVRKEIDKHFKLGEQALARRDASAAKDHFQKALSLVLAEPALNNEGTRLLAWYDQSWRDGEQQRWKWRRPPTPPEERRDEGILLCVLLDPQKPESVLAARKAIQSALEFADPNKPREREQLLLLDADLALRQDDAAKGLAILNQPNGINSRMGHQRRADCLDRLGRKGEAEEERVKAAKLPTDDALEFFLAGVDRCQRRDYAGAVGDFNKVLALEPDHFTSRFLQAVCFLHLKRPAEARIALTACIGQRPNWAWNHVFRGQAHTQLAEFALAATDFQRPREMTPCEPALRYMNQPMEALGASIASLSAERREEIGQQKIQTDTGLQELRDLPAFRDFFRAPK